MRQKIINKIFEIAPKENAFTELEKFLNNLAPEQISKNLIGCGVLPEMFEHDSSEEKLWAKYSDILLAKSLSLINIPSEVLRARGNSADVFGKNKFYSIIGDAKTFRLSRTAKNQKDFKIKALDDWRKNDNYAILVSPLLQFPIRKSQIYSQAIEKNVTILSYTHLKFILDFYQNQDLEKLWQIGKELQSLSKNDFQFAKIYWQKVDKVICNILSKNLEDLNSYKEETLKETRFFANEGVKFWESKIQEYQKFSKQEAISRLIKSEKLEQKIITIKKSINREIEI